MFKYSEIFQIEIFKNVCISKWRFEFRFHDTMGKHYRRITEKKFTICRFGLNVVI